MSRNSNVNEHIRANDNGNRGDGILPIPNVFQSSLTVQNMMGRNNGSNMAFRSMPKFGLSLGYTSLMSPIFMGQMPTLYTNPLIINPIMANLPQFGTHMAQIGSAITQSVGSKGNKDGPIFPNMPRAMPTSTPSYMADSLATF